MRISGALPHKGLGFFGGTALSSLPVTSAVNFDSGGSCSENGRRLLKRLRRTRGTVVTAARVTGEVTFTESVTVVTDSDANQVGGRLSKDMFKFSL